MKRLVIRGDRLRSLSFDDPSAGRDINAFCPKFAPSGSNDPRTVGMAASERHSMDQTWLTRAVVGVPRIQQRQNDRLQSLEMRA